MEQGEAPPEVKQKATTTPQKDLKIPEKKLISRRKFLKRLGLGLGAAVVTAPVAVKALEMAVYKGISEGLKASQTLDSVIDSANELSKSAENENPSFRPMTEIIKEGIQNYQNSSQNPVRYSRSSSYRDKEYYAEQIRKLATSSVLPRNPADVPHDVASKMPGEALDAYISSDARFVSFEDIFTTGSGFYDRFRKNHPDLINSLGGDRTAPGTLTETEKLGRQEILDTKSHVENIVAGTNNPVSTSRVLEYFFE